MIDNKLNIEKKRNVFYFLINQKDILFTQHSDRGDGAFYRQLIVASAL